MRLQKIQGKRNYNKQKKTIFFDLDGPIIDVSRRYFFVHKIICQKLGVKKIGTLESYWRETRRKISYEELLHTKNKALIDRYKYLWLANIEKQENFRKDKIFSYSKGVMQKLAKNNNLVLVTLRRKKKTLLKELFRFGLKKYFKEIFVVFDNNIEHHVSKYKAVKKSSYFKKDAVFVGDTEVDIKAAKMLEIKIIGVTSGIRNKKTLKTFKPDAIIKDITLLERRLL